MRQSKALRLSIPSLQKLPYNRSCISPAFALLWFPMASEIEPPQAEIHFEGDSLEVLSRFPDEIKRRLGFSLSSSKLGGGQHRQPAA
jgi:hypothetical protein